MIMGKTCQKKPTKTYQVPKIFRSRSGSTYKMHCRVKKEARRTEDPLYKQLKNDGILRGSSVERISDDCILVKGYKGSRNLRRVAEQLSEDYGLSITTSGKVEKSKINITAKICE